ncbi:hypothetical protein S40288_08194 [Stachybotrys chartarum IBT 40288]|nr:hypothetical protein S40288_08194 [Stachybotrys chartarum IBT 40288]
MARIRILDGGLGTTLERRFDVHFSHARPLWSSDLLISDPDTLLACQSAFGRVPVDILLTATYQVSVEGFAATTQAPEFPNGVGVEAIPRFLETAVSVAARAKQASAQIALSLGPYGACMVPSQEYSGEYDAAHSSAETLREWHRRRLGLFASLGGHVLSSISYVAWETVPRVDEVVAVRTALAATPELSSLPYWISCLYPGDDGTLPDGTSAREAVATMLNPELPGPSPWGIGINCTKVHKLDGLLRQYEAAIESMVQQGRIGKWPALVLYPDGTNGEVYNPTTQQWELPADAVAAGRSPWEEVLAQVVQETSARELAPPPSQPQPTHVRTQRSPLHHLRHNPPRPQRQRDPPRPMSHRHEHPALGSTPRPHTLAELPVLQPRQYRRAARRHRPEAQPRPHNLQLPLRHDEPPRQRLQLLQGIVDGLRARGERRQRDRGRVYAGEVDDATGPRVQLRGQILKTAVHSMARVACALRVAHDEGVPGKVAELQGIAAPGSAMRQTHKSAANLHNRRSTPIIHNTNFIPLQNPQPRRTLVPTIATSSRITRRARPTGPALQPTALHSAPRRLVRHGDALRVAPFLRAARLLREPRVLLEAQPAERGARGLEPALGEEPAREAGCRGEELGGAVDEVDGGAGLVLGEVIGGGEADDAAADDDCLCHDARALIYNLAVLLWRDVRHCSKWHDIGQLPRNPHFGTCSYTDSSLPLAALHRTQPCFTRRFATTMATSKVFIITGASKGLGAAIAHYLLKQSHKVVLAARSRDLLEAIKSSYPGQVELIAGDMTSENIATDLVKLAVKSYGHIDGIVLNHGILDNQKLRDTSIERIKYVYDVNVYSCLALAKAGLEELRKTRGSIVWISSGAATKPYTAWGAYGSSKAALNSISSHIAAEEPEITSVAIAPGRVDTEMQALIRSSGKDTMDKAQYDNFVEVFEQGKLLKPEQPGNVIAKFAADPTKDLSGKFLNWNAAELAAYQE